MKNKFTLFLFLNLALSGFAQTNYKPNKTAFDKDSLVSNRFEISTDLLWLIYKNSLPGYCLQLKVNTNSKRHPGAFRFKLGMNIESKDSSLQVYYPNLYYRTNDKVFYIRPGYQLNYSYDRVLLYWGVDLHFLYSRYYMDKYDGPELFMDNHYYNSYLLYTLTKQQYGFVGLIGVAYSLKPRVSISMETNISFLYINVKSDSYYHYKEFPDYKNILGGTETSFLDIKFTPISTINLIIKF